MQSHKIDVTEKMAEFAQKIEHLDKAISRYSASQCSASELQECQEMLKTRQQLLYRLGVLAAQHINRGF